MGLQLVHNAFFILSAIGALGLVICIIITAAALPMKLKNESFLRVIFDICFFVVVVIVLIHAFVWFLFGLGY